MPGFSDYTPAGTGAYRFRDPRGRQFLFSGEEAERQKRLIDESRRPLQFAQAPTSFDEAEKLGRYDAPTFRQLIEASARPLPPPEQPKKPPQEIRPNEGAQGGSGVPRQDDGAGGAPGGGAGGRVRDEIRAEVGRIQERPGDAAAAFGRSAVVGALDTAALPVTGPARVARYLGATHPAIGAAADLSADEALQDATWLATGEEAGAYRDRVAREREEFPGATYLGTETGASAAGAGLGAIGSRVAARALPGARRGARIISEDVKYPFGAPIADEITEETAFQARKRAIAFAKDHAHGATVRRYTTTGYEEMNKAAAQRAPMYDRTAKAISEIDTFLDDAKRAGHVHTGEVLRGMQVPADVVAEWQSKGVLKNGSFWSTTTDEETARRFMDQSADPGLEKVLLRIRQKKGGVPVGFGEDEVLMDRGRYWRIGGAERIQTKRGPALVMDVEEIDPVPDDVPYALTFDDKRSAAGLVSVAPTPQGAVVADAKEKQRSYAEPIAPTARSTQANR